MRTTGFVNFGTLGFAMMHYGPRNPVGKTNLHSTNLYILTRQDIGMLATEAASKHRTAKKHTEARELGLFRVASPTRIISDAFEASCRYPLPSTPKS